MSVQDFGSQFALDMQGLQRLKHTARQDPSAGLQDAAQQFEALFVQMMLKSMRDAIPTTGLLDSQQTEFYQSLLDQQWAQTMAGRGIGLADHLVAQLEGQGVEPSRQTMSADRDQRTDCRHSPRYSPGAKRCAAAGGDDPAGVWHGRRRDARELPRRVGGGKR